MWPVRSGPASSTQPSTRPVWRPSVTESRGAGCRTARVARSVRARGCLDMNPIFWGQARGAIECSLLGGCGDPSTRRRIPPLAGTGSEPAERITNVARLSGRARTRRGAAADAALLVVSELVSNAVPRWRSDRVRAAVRTGHRPRRRFSRRAGRRPWGRGRTGWRPESCPPSCPRGTGWGRRPESGR